MARRPLIATAACALLLAGCGSSSSKSTSSTTASSTPAASSQTSTSSSQQVGFEGMPIEQGATVASPSTTGTKAVNGITCGLKEQLAYHTHSHLSVFENGQPRALPGGIGIPGSKVVQSTEGPVASGGQCIYWLHTHAPDGVIHVESPTKRIYTLGDFFDIWRQPLSHTQVGDVKGTISAIVNGKPWTKDVRAIPLLPHAVIQLNVGQPAVPFQAIAWGNTGL
jgi:hypothetical protein